MALFLEMCVFKFCETVTTKKVSFYKLHDTLSIVMDTVGVGGHIESNCMCQSDVQFEMEGTRVYATRNLNS